MQCRGPYIKVKAKGYTCTHMRFRVGLAQGSAGCAVLKRGRLLPFSLFFGEWALLSTCAKKSPNNHFIKNFQNQNRIYNTGTRGGQNRIYNTGTRRGGAQRPVRSLMLALAASSIAGGSAKDFPTMPSPASPAKDGMKQCTSLVGSPSAPGFTSGFSTPALVCARVYLQVSGKTRNGW